MFVLTDGAVSLNHVPLLILFFSFHDAIRQPLCYSHEALLEHDKKNANILEGAKLYITNIYRRPLKEFKDSEPELLFEEVYLADGSGKYIAYALKSDLKYESKINEDTDEPYIRASMEVIRLYNTETKEEIIISDKRGVTDGSRHSGKITFIGNCVSFRMDQYEDQYSPPMVYYNVESSKTSLIFLFDE